MLPTVFFIFSCWHRHCSGNWAVWVPEILKNYDPDSIRYFLIINAPENRDADFSWREFIYSHNSEQLGAFANFVNRTLKFIAKSFNNKVPEAKVNNSIKLDVEHFTDLPTELNNVEPLYERIDVKK